jgi:hypothetical protein
MDATVQVALVAGGAALVSAVVTSLLAPHINWGIEKKKALLQQQRETIDKWRQVLEDLNRYYSQYKEDIKILYPIDYLMKQKGGYSLKPYLSQHALKELDSNHYPGITEVLTDEISRIEQKWRLAPPVDKPKKLKITSS